MNSRKLVLAAMASAAIAASPADARKKQPPPPPVPVRPAPILALSSPNALTVNYFHERRQEAPLWFGSAGGNAATAELLSILRRAAIDGLPTGPTTAAQVEAYVLKAQSGDPLAVKTAERALSIAWVDYVQALQRPNTNVIWGDPTLTLKPGHPDRILALLSAAPSLAEHLKSVSSVNPYYSALREAALAEAQANGGRPSEKLSLNLERARILPANGRYIFVNVAEQRLHMMEGGRSVGSMKVVVGDAKPPMELPTPIIASTMHYAIANPYWHVPPHLIRKMAPNIAKSPAAYLKDKRYEVISDFGKNPTIIDPTTIDWKAVAAGTATVILRQKPGGQNSMGDMKFPFPNREGIFLHDTPTRVHFGKDDRAISNGCIRVEDYRRLAHWLFQGRNVAAETSAPEQHLQLPRGVPVFVTYLTMVPGEAGAGLTTFADRYDWDRPGALAGGMPARGISTAAAGSTGSPD
jgi:murein L,D-transpeptidase YcbB/YkuD